MSDCVRTIVPEENYPLVRVRVWFRVRVTIRVEGKFSSCLIALEPCQTLDWIVKKSLFVKIYCVTFTMNPVNIVSLLTVQTILLLIC